MFTFKTGSFLYVTCVVLTVGGQGRTWKLNYVNSFMHISLQNIFRRLIHFAELGSVRVFIKLEREKTPFKLYIMFCHVVFIQQIHVVHVFE